MEEKREAVIDARGGEQIQFNDFLYHGSREASDDQELKKVLMISIPITFFQFESVQLKDKKKAQQRGRKRVCD